MIMWWLDTAVVCCRCCFVCSVCSIDNVHANACTHTHTHLHTWLSTLDTDQSDENFKCFAWRKLFSTDQLNIQCLPLEVRTHTLTLPCQATQSQIDANLHSFPSAESTSNIMYISCTIRVPNIGRFTIYVNIVDMSFFETYNPIYRTAANKKNHSNRWMHNMHNNIDT